MVAQYVSPTPNDLGSRQDDEDDDGLILIINNIRSNNRITICYLVETERSLYYGHRIQS